LFFYTVVAFLPMMEVRKAHTPCDRLFRRVVEIAQGCSSNAEVAVLLDTPHIRMAMDPAGSPIEWEPFMTQTTAHDFVLSAQNGE